MLWKQKTELERLQGIKQKKNRTSKSSGNPNKKQNCKIFLKNKTANKTDFFLCFLKIKLRKCNQTVYKIIMNLNVIMYGPQRKCYTAKRITSLLHFDKTVLNNLTITCIPELLRLQVTYNRTDKNKGNKNRNN